MWSKGDNIGTFSSYASHSAAPPPPHLLEVIAEGLHVVAARHLGCEELGIVHVGHEQHGGAAAHPTGAAQQQGAPRGGEHAVKVGKALQDLSKGGGLRARV